MNTTSQIYNFIFSAIHRFEVKVSIAGTDYGMNVLTSQSSNRSVFGSGSPRLGLAPAGKLIVTQVPSGLIRSFNEKIQKTAQFITNQAVFMVESGGLEPSTFRV